MAPVAGLMFVKPLVQVKAVEANALSADGDFYEVRADCRVEYLAVHPEVSRGIT
jgi:hypothetical protein